MNRFKDELVEEATKTKEIIRRAKKEIKQLKPYEGSVIVRTRGEQLNFFLRSCKEDGKNGKYVPKSKQAQAIDAVKYEYYGRIISKLEKRLKLINKLVANVDDTDAINIYKKMSTGKQRIVTSIEESDDDYRKRWEAYEYKGKEFGESDSEIFTERGERVRSKSEKIIADKLYAEGIPYRYECPINMIGGKIIYPDFTILDMNNRRNIILEHFGMMDNDEYADNAVGKIQMYNRNGWVLGDNLLITMETRSRPFDSRVLDGLISKML